MQDTRWTCQGSKQISETTPSYYYWVTDVPFRKTARHSTRHEKEPLNWKGFAPRLTEKPWNSASSLTPLSILCGTLVNLWRWHAFIKFTWCILSLSSWYLYLIVKTRKKGRECIRWIRIRVRIRKATMGEGHWGGHWLGWALRGRMEAMNRGTLPPKARAHCIHRMLANLTKTYIKK